MDMGERFTHLLDVYRRSDGTRWTGADIERATHGQVSRFYVSRLRRGLIEDPSFTKIAEISRTMGVPLDEWTSPPER